ERAERGELEAYDASVRSPDNDRRAVYYHEMSNGWQVVLTVPFETLLSGLEQFTLVFFIVMAACLAAIVVTAWRDIRLNAQIERTNETIRVLGNSYYALYRVDC